MRNFLRAVSAVVVGLLVFTVGTVLVGFLFFAGLAANSSGNEEVNVKANSVLRLKFNRPLVEYTSSKPNPFEDLSIPTGLPFTNVAQPMGLVNIKETLTNAKIDGNIKGIYLDVNVVAGGWTQLYDIRNALLDFKESGKFIYAYGEIMEEKAYFLASVADKVFVMEEGLFAFLGLSVEKMYYKGMFDKVGLKPEIFKVGDFKSYVEPYLRTDMSEADRKQTSAYLNSIYDFYLSQVSESRNIPQDSLRKLSDEALVDTPHDAVKFSLIDGAIYEDSVLNVLREMLEIDADDKINFITYGKYQNAPKQITKKYSKTKVAVIFGEGAIGSGKSKQGESIGSETIVKELRKARKDDNVKAIVLRINSPGGSALASDEMWREVQMVKKSGKPIIASMSDVAASGGYYMAMSCDRIIAQPNTITGSIGIFAILMDASSALEDKVGLTFDRVNTGELSDLGSPTKAFSEHEKATLQNFVDRGYDDFTQKAAEGRNMTQDSLKKIASGRVWTGEQALKNGLIDEFGDLDYAITLAADAAELDEGYSVSYRPKAKGVLEELLGSGFAKTQADKEIKAQLGPLAPYWQELKTISEMQGLQARLPYQIRIVSKMRVQK